MKLAAALTERADLQTRIQQMQTRLNNNAKVQEGEKPAENPDVLLEEFEGMMIRLEELIARINHTNSVTKIGDKTLTDYLAKRDCLKQKIAILRGFLNNASERINRYSQAEIRIVSTVDVASLQKDVDRLAKELRVVDEKIQEVNWTTDLLGEE